MVEQYKMLGSGDMLIVDCGIREISHFQTCKLRDLSKNIKDSQIGGCKLIIVFVISFNLNKFLIRISYSFTLEEHQRNQQ